MSLQWGVNGLNTSEIAADTSDVKSRIENWISINIQEGLKVKST